MTREVFPEESYRLLHPKLTFFLTSAARDGRPNVMACSWAMPVSAEPPVVIVGVAKESFTAELIQETREFVINIPTKRLLKALRLCGTVSGRTADKFEKAGLRSAEGSRVKPPSIEGCAGYLECRLWKKVDAGECWAFFGRIVAAAADGRYFKKGVWTAEAHIPFHLGNGKMVYVKKDQ